MAACIAAPIFGSTNWNADAFEATSIAYRVSSGVSAAVNNHLRYVSLAGNLWKLDTHLKNLLETFYTAVSSPDVAQPQASEDQIRTGLANLRNLYTQVDAIYTQAKSARLTNRSIVGVVLNSIRVRSDDLLEIVESVELAMDQAPAIEEIFRKSLEEHQHGESFDLASIK